MANKLYEDWWMNLSEGGIYYRNKWYATEEELNSHGYYITSNRQLYLGQLGITLKYHNIYYAINSEYLTYEIAHARGYTLIPSNEIDLSDSSGNTVKCYYNNEDGYFADGVWYRYNSLQSLLDNTDYYKSKEQIIYYDMSNNLYLDYNKTRNSTSFNTTDTIYRRPLYLDERMTVPLIYNGSPVVVKYGSATNSKCVYSVNELPTSTTGSTTNNICYLILVISETGDPLQPLKESDIGKPLYIYSCTNYNSNIYWSSTPFSQVIIGTKDE